MLFLCRLPRSLIHVWFTSFAGIKVFLLPLVFSWFPSTRTELCKVVPAKLQGFLPIFPKLADCQSGAEWSYLAATKPQKFKDAGIILHISVEDKVDRCSHFFGILAPSHHRKTQQLVTPRRPSVRVKEATL